MMGGFFSVQKFFLYVLGKWNNFMNFEDFCFSISVDYERK